MQIPIPIPTPHREPPTHRKPPTPQGTPPTGNPHSPNPTRNPSIHREPLTPQGTPQGTPHPTGNPHPQGTPTHREPHPTGNPLPHREPPYSTGTLPTSQGPTQGTRTPQRNSLHPLPSSLSCGLLWFSCSSHIHRLAPLCTGKLSRSGT